MRKIESQVLKRCTVLKKLTVMKKRWLIILFLPLFVFFSFLIADRLFPLPITSLKPTQTILANDNSPLWRFADEHGIWRYPVTLEDVPDYYLDALLTYEDRWFYKHWGVNPFSIMRAAWQYITNGRIISGGSTLSMQVARLIEPHKKTLLGKLHQVFRTFQLEWHYSKDEILTLYINRAPYGGTLEGVGAASWSYLGKAPNEMTRNEAVLLAILPQAPSRLRPDRYPERAQQARNKVLDRLAEYQVWPQEVIDDIYNDDVWVFPRKTPQLAPLLARRLSQENPTQQIIKTTIDASLQDTLEELAINYKNQLPPKTSLAMLVVDHTDMQVKAYIGSIDFNDEQRFGHVDMIRAWRSPGSTLKPFLFAMAIDEGLINSESLLQDVPRVTTDYRPRNFDEGFNGPVGAAESLVRSLNLPAVQLLEAYGPKRFTAKLNAMGLSLLSTGSEPNLSYILGGAATTLEKLVSTYSLFARKGYVGSLRYLDDSSLNERFALSHGSAWIVRRILAGDGRPPLNKNVSDYVSLSWKTGTSYGYRDALAIGVSSRYLIGIWVGRPDGTPVAGQYGRTTAVPILHQVNTVLTNRERNLNLPMLFDPKPESVSSGTICWPSGESLASTDSNCHRQRRGWIYNSIYPPTLDSITALKSSTYRAGRVKIWLNEKGLRVASDCLNAAEKQVAIWPISLDSWLQPNERRSHLIPAIDPSCPVLNETIYSKLIMTGIMDKQFIRPLPGKQTVTMNLNSIGGFGLRWWFLDGELIKETQFGEKLSLNIEKPGKHTLLLLDDSGQIDQISFTLDF